MTGLAHVVLHLALCGPIARLAPQSAFPLHVRVSDRINRPQVDRTFSLERGYGDEAVVEFDAPRGLYRLQISVPKYRCNASDFLVFLPDRERNIAERLQAGPYTEDLPLLLSGTTPPAFSYSRPEVVAFERTAACNQPISNPIPLRAHFENDQDSYYAQLFTQRHDSPNAPLLVALKLRSAAAQYHYVRIPVTLPIPLTAWPVAYQLNIPEGYIDEVATEPVDTLLCPKFIKTSVE